MSKANVTFETMNYDPAEPGQEVRFSFDCPKRPGKQCVGLLIRTSETIRPSWVWDGDRDTPTFTPSIDCKNCWHGYIRTGRCVDTNGVDEP